MLSFQRRVVCQHKRSWRENEVETAAQSKAKSASIRAVIIGVDGKVKHNLGVISYWHRNPLKRGLWKIKQFIGLERK
jgi:hypothetical protein